VQHRPRPEPSLEPDAVGRKTDALDPGIARCGIHVDVGVQLADIGMTVPLDIELVATEEARQEIELFTPRAGDTFPRRCSRRSGSPTGSRSTMS
jgi:hypothetical protein